jgi:hypothetical protein
MIVGACIYNLVVDHHGIFSAFGNFPYFDHWNLQAEGEMELPQMGLLEVGLPDLAGTHLVG